MNIPAYVIKVTARLKREGYQAWVVGGSIRDLIIGKQASDFDVATDARPEQVLKLFRRTIPTGIKHGTVTVLADGHSV